jgi:hypothetical protein
VGIHSSTAIIENSKEDPQTNISSNLTNGYIYKGNKTRMFKERFFSLKGK